MSAESDFMGMIMAFMNDDPMTATYHQYTEGEYNTETSEYETTEINTSVRCILLDFENVTRGLSSKFGTEIQAGDKELWMLPTQKADPLATPIIPNPTSDRITVAGIKYKIVVVKDANPTGSNPLVYNMMLRR